MTPQQGSFSREADIVFITESGPILISGVGGNQYEHGTKAPARNHLLFVVCSLSICFRLPVDTLATRRVTVSELCWSWISDILSAVWVCILDFEE